MFVTHETDIAWCATRNVYFKDGLILRENIVIDRTIATEMLAGIPEEENQKNLKNELFEFIQNCNKRLIKK